MCKRLIRLIIIILLVSAGNASADPAVSIGLNPSVRLPVLESADSFGIGGQALAIAEISFGSNIRPLLGLGAGYAYDSTFIENSVSSVIGSFSAGAVFDLSRTLSLRLIGNIGYTYLMLNYPDSVTVEGETTGGGTYAGGGIGIDFMVSPSFDIGFDAEYLFHAGYSGAVFSLCTRYYVSGKDTRLERLREDQRRDGPQTPAPGSGLELLETEVAPIFPVFYSFYDDNPVGSALLVNHEDLPASDIHVELFIPQYMDSPKECIVPDQLDKGDSAAIDLFALFKEDILFVTQGTKVSMDLIISYNQDGLPYERVQTRTVDIHHRNAMTWDDDRRAAAFVTQLDPSVASFSRNITGMTRNRAPLGLNIPFTTALALHEALDLFGLSYVLDPTTPYTEYSESATMTDVLQFPAQTLDYRAGDCDDLSILYCALLEASGVGSAFVTVPGHIYTAVNLELSPAEARRTFSEPEKLIITDEGSVWLPVEITERSGGFLKAWEKGASQWRAGEGRLYPVRDAWKTYKAVGFPGERPTVSLPPVSEMVTEFAEELSRFIENEISVQAEPLMKRIQQSGGDLRYSNRLGVLYARYGRIEEAEKIFRDILTESDYIPARMNLGNLLYLNEDYYGALEQFELSRTARPEKAAISLAIAKTHHALENYGIAAAEYKRVAELDEQLAAENSFLGGVGEQEQRAAEIGLRSVIWEEDLE